MIVMEYLERVEELRFPAWGMKEKTESKTVPGFGV